LAVINWTGFLFFLIFFGGNGQLFQIQEFMGHGLKSESNSMYTFQPEDCINMKFYIKTWECIGMEFYNDINFIYLIN